MTRVARDPDLAPAGDNIFVQSPEYEMATVAREAARVAAERDTARAVPLSEAELQTVDAARAALRGACARGSARSADAAEWLRTVIQTATGLAGQLAAIRERHARDTGAADAALATLDQVADAHGMDRAEILAGDGDDMARLWPPGRFDGSDVTLVLAVAGELAVHVQYATEPVNVAAVQGALHLFTERHVRPALRNPYA